MAASPGTFPSSAKAHAHVLAAGEAGVERSGRGLCLVGYERVCQLCGEARFEGRQPYDGRRRQIVEAGNDARLGGVTPLCEPDFLVDHSRVDLAVGHRVDLALPRRDGERIEEGVEREALAREQDRGREVARRAVGVDVAEPGALQLLPRGRGVRALHDEHAALCRRPCARGECAGEAAPGAIVAQTEAVGRRQVREIELVFEQSRGQRVKIESAGDRAAGRLKSPAQWGSASGNSRLVSKPPLSGRVAGAASVMAPALADTALTLRRADALQFRQLLTSAFDFHLVRRRGRTTGSRRPSMHR